MEEYQDFKTLYTSLSGTKFTSFADKLIFKIDMTSYKSSGTKFIPKTKHVKFFSKHILILKVTIILIQNDQVKKGKLIPLDFGCRVTFLTESPSGETIQGFKIEKKEESYSLFTKDLVGMDQVKTFLKRQVNQSGFHETFKALKKLGKGNFAHVYLVEHKVNGEKYAVKAFNKESAYGQKNGRVSNYI